MSQYVIARVGSAAIVLWALVTVVFGISHVLGDPATLMAPLNASPEQIETIRESLGFSDPLATQYVRFMDGAVRGDFGVSVWQSQPSLGLVLERLPATLQLAALTIAVATAGGLILGIVAAQRAGGLVDRLVGVLAVTWLSTPNFWIGLMLILLFGVYLRLVPTQGYGGVAHFVLPVATLAPATMGRLSQITRASMVDVLAQPYITAARSKGLSEFQVVLRHALKNALLPILTVSGNELAILVGGSVVVETVFGWPGAGLLTSQAIFQRDVPLVEACVVLIGSMVIGINLLVDLAYRQLDPRIRL